MPEVNPHSQPHMQQPPHGPQQPSMDRNLERLMLLVYSIHQVMMLGVEIYQHWPAWIMFVFAVALIIEWGLHTVQYGNAHARQVVDLCMMEVCFFIYAMYREDLVSVLIPFASIVVLVGLASYTDLVHITVVALIVFVVYHGFVVHSIHIAGFENFLTYAIPVMNVSLIQSVIYFWIQKRNANAKKMQEVIRDLRMAERSKDDFLANVSHEIRTPINTINGMSEVILQEDVNKVVRDNIYNIQTAGRNLMSVVSDILDFSELQSGKMEIIEENYNITSTINDIINMSMAQKSRKRLELVVDCDPNLPRGLLGDEKKIRRVVMNLVNNAIKFTDEGGIGIEITFRREFYGINLIITVQDSGIGMDAESVGSLFTSYNQVDTGKNRKNGGIGLGLAISKAIVQGMGGVITVRSRFGKGTSIRVTIPQKVTDERPIVEITNREKVNALEYTNMERITMRDVRDGYAKVLINMGRRLGVASHMCRSFEELKRRAEHDTYSHIFIGFDDYMEHPDFYDGICQKTKVVVALDEANEGKISNRNLILVYKPLYVIPVASILNGSVDRHKVNDRSHRQSFIAQDVKVLIVDDNVMNIRVVQGLLAKYKIRSVQALSGMESLEKIESKEFDLVFMDHMMPEMDGIETFHRIREKGGSYYTRVPIVALTANAVAGAREMFLDEGFDDFVEKPVDISVLERVLQRNLPAEKLIMTEELPEEEVSGGESFSAEREAAGEGRPANAFAVGDLDVEAGQMYCGGRESYLEILKEYVQKGAENWDPIEELFEKQDVKNYTIAVHAVKSSMLAIGARPLSEMAKKLEAAGKENNTAYILENHAPMLEEFKRVIGEIAESGYIKLETKQEDAAQNLPALADEVFEQKAIELEDAMYDFDGAKMTAILKELSGYAYHGTALKEPLSGVFRKVEMSDYMAAVEVVLKLKDKLKNEGREGA